MDKKMIITRTPLRITFVGGGTDLASYYRLNGPGAVINAAINKYIYIVINKKFDDAIRLSYSKTEIVKTVDEIRHPAVKAALKYLGIDGGIEIVSISDIPSRGTGLGSSSSFVVGLLNALHAWKGELVGPKQLAEEALYLRNELNEGEGKQDEYAAAYGGFHLMEFHKDESVELKPIVMGNTDIEKFKNHLLLMYTGKQRSATDILKNQATNVGAHVDAYNSMRDLAYELYNKLTSGNWQDTGELLHKNWLLKKTLAGEISDELIDQWYNKGIHAGATGGKLIGAGGGGFLLFFAPPEKHESIIKALPELKPVAFDFEPFGSRIIFVGD